MSILELHKVSKVYGQGDNEVDAITDIELVVERGSLVAIMGPSGSGKSTMLRCINFLEQYEAGEIRSGGERLHGRVYLRWGAKAILAIFCYHSF